MLFLYSNEYVWDNEVKCRRGKYMFKITNYTDNDDVKVIAEKGSFQVVEFQRDLSVSPFDA